ncbi:MAG TPA: response regulator transcription factor [Pyrinomonadaceae bacterium]
MKQIRILIADDHQMFSQGLAALLESVFAVIGIVGDGQRLIETAIRLQPDVILVDISMPVLNGLDAAQKLSAAIPKTKIVFLTMHADVRLMTEAFRAGAAGYVLKQSAGEELICAIQQVVEGKQFISPLLSAEIERGTSLTETKKTNLTPRQREVLRLISEGYTMKQTAQSLGISTRTAESYKYEMMTELGVATTAELIQYAIKLGLSGK